MTTKLQQQIETITNAGSELERDSEPRLQLETLLSKAISQRDSGETDPIEIPSDLANEINQHQLRQTVSEFNRQSSEQLREACKKAGAKNGSEDYFSDRLVSVNGVPHLKTKDGGTAPISAAIVRSELPPALMGNSDARRQDEYGDLRDLIEIQQQKVADAKKLVMSSRNDNGHLTVHRRENAKLKELVERRDAILAEKEAERNPPTPPKAPTPAELGKLDSLQTKAAKLKAIAKADPQNHKLADYSVARRAAEAYAKQIGA